jgi:hypothetical protein
MKILLVSSVLAVTAVVCAAPVMAHHPSQDPEFVEEQMPEDALEAHIDAVDAVLDRLEEMGMTTMDGNQTGASNFDPADMQQGATCSDVVDGVCDEMGNDAMSGSGAGAGAGMTRGPVEYPLATP